MPLASGALVDENSIAYRISMSGLARSQCLTACGTKGASCPAATDKKTKNASTQVPNANVCHRAVARSLRACSLPNTIKAAAAARGGNWQASRMEFSVMKLSPPERRERSQGIAPRCAPTYGRERRSQPIGVAVSEQEIQHRHIAMVMWASVQTRTHAAEFARIRRDTPTPLAYAQQP